MVGKKIQKEDKRIKYLTISIVIGVLILSLGVFMVGKHVPYGNIILTIGSAILYFSIIILAFIV